MRVHHPTQLVEEPVHVGVLLLRAVEVFHARCGLCEAQSVRLSRGSSPRYCWDDRRVPPRRAMRAPSTRRWSPARRAHSAVSCLRVTADSSGRAALLVAHSVSTDKECSGCSRRTSVGTGAGPRTITTACSSGGVSFTDTTYRGAGRGRRGRRAFCGASNRCRWAPRQRVQRPGRHREFWCGRHQPGRCKRMDTLQ